MQHAEAVRSMSSEKYLLDELTPELREQFEEHFFSCQECALDVRAGAAFLEHGKIALAEPARVQPAIPATSREQKGWLAWLRPAFALPVMALLLIAVGYESLVVVPGARNEVAELQAPQVLPSASLMSARSDRVPSVSAKPNQPFLLFVDIPADSQFSSYSCDLYSPSGAVLWSLPISADAARNTLPLKIPAVRADSGRYSLAVSGIEANRHSTVLVRYPFELQVQR